GRRGAARGGAGRRGAARGGAGRRGAASERAAKPPRAPGLQRSDAASSGCPPPHSSMRQPIGPLRAAMRRPIEPQRAGRVLRE
ncbi:hypothetical protein ABT369_31535, partial [Dactylosporangium sp. NPDC000244]|uniref:hypothetical protein n=1 Tax=Dactylosporangium sp. NPDC000244 TaxID=3154365 RepID=UPI00332B10C7